jgi:hypothetical protein
MQKCNSKTHDTESQIQIRILRGRGVPAGLDAFKLGFKVIALQGKLVALPVAF